MPVLVTLGGQAVDGRGDATARIDDWTTWPAPGAEAASEEGFRSVVGAPIIVEGTLWA